MIKKKVLSKVLPKKKFVLTPKIKIIALSLVIVSLLIAGAYFAKGFFVSAVVNGKPVFRYSLLTSLEKSYGKNALESEIVKVLVAQKAKEIGVKVTSEDIKAEISKIEEQVKAQGGNLDSLLSMQGQTRSDLESAISLKLVVEKILADKLSVNEDDLKKYFDENKEAFGGKTLAQVKDQVESSLKEEKLSTAYQEWVSEAMKNSKILYW